MISTKRVIIILLSLLLLALLACNRSISPSSGPGTSVSPSASPPSSKAPAAKETSPASTAAGVSFARKTITLVVPFSAGGATDIAARGYARFLPKYLPGEPTVVVRNMPGGASTIGSNYVYAAKPDGLTVLNSAGGIQLNQLAGLKSVHYDLLKMPAIIAVGTGGVIYAKTGLVQKPADLPKAKGLVCGIASGGNSPYFVIVAKELLNIPVDKMILAYGGATDAIRAFLSGEINMSALGTSVYLQSIVPLVSKGEAMPLLQTGLLDATGNVIKAAGVPTDVPTPRELYEQINGKSPSGLVWDVYRSVVAAGYNYQGDLFLPPGTPDDIVRAYWKAGEAMLKDAEFLKLSDILQGEGVRWVAGEAFDKEFKTNFQMDPKIVEWVRSTLPKYGVSVD